MRGSGDVKELTEIGPVACQVNPADLTLGIMALVAQQEREATSRRTKEALAVARSRGVRLGNPNGAGR
jgi:DNA invertase Pin-like site-specific DNA recombinase